MVQMNDTGETQEAEGTEEITRAELPVRDPGATTIRGGENWPVDMIIEY